MKFDFPDGCVIHDLIGVGGFGQVFKGTDHVHGLVAVKTFEKEVGDDDDTWHERKSDMLNEGRRLKDAEHDNVVRVFRVIASNDGSAVGLVMEFCGGGSLQPAFEAGPMRFQDIRDVLSDAALGLEAIHARGMLHRDIKPSNIFRARKNRSKIGDFGLVTDRIVVGYASAAGYADHVAPEVYETGLTSQKTDVWAFGMTAYRLLHGKGFYDESPKPATIVSDGGFAAGLAWLPHIPSAWRRFITRCLHDDSTKRFANASELLRGLESLPITPDWSCTYASDRVVWEAPKNTTIVRVEWIKHSARKHEWVAKGISKTTRKERKLSGSAGVISKRDALSELKNFFQGQNTKA
jgi:serine/threonine-protein kinase